VEAKGTRRKHRPPFRPATPPSGDGQDNGAFQAIANTVLDHYLGAPPKDWVTAFSAVVKRRREEAEKSVRDAAATRGPSSKPSLSLDSYAGLLSRPLVWRYRQ
jgi:hypothetical protein